MDMNLSKLQKTVEDGEPGVLQSIGSQRVRHNSATEQQQMHRGKNMFRHKEKIAMYMLKRKASEDANSA